MNITTTDYFDIGSLPYWIFVSYVVAGAFGSDLIQQFANTSRINTERAASIRKEPTVKARTSDAQEYFARLCSEEPATPENDRYNRYSQAVRLASLLMHQSVSTIALLGAYGSGKSTVFKYMQQCFDGHNNTTCKVCGGAQQKYVMVTIAAWDIAPKALPQILLRRAISELAKATDTLSVASLPANYIKSIAGIGGWFKALGGVLNQEEDPMEMLTYLDALLIASGICLVIAVEDVERNGQPKAALAALLPLLDRIKTKCQLRLLIAVGV